MLKIPTFLWKIQQPVHNLKPPSDLYALLNLRFNAFNLMAFDLFTSNYTGDIENNLHQQGHP